jgi:chromosome segregation ATPase
MISSTGKQSSAEQRVTIDDLREAQQNAEQKAVECHSQMRALEAELRQLGLNGGLDEEQRDEERDRIKTAHRELAGRQRQAEEWIGHLRRLIENLELRTAGPRRELSQIDAQLATIDERLATLGRQMLELQGERDALLLRRDAAQALIDGVVIEMPEQPRYPAPRAVYQAGAPTRWLDTAGNEVAQDGSPLLST